MGEINRLGALQMSVAGDEHVGVLPAHLHERRLQTADGKAQFHDFLAQPQPHVQRDLIVARAAGVELGPGRLAAGQGVLNVHVDILQILAPDEFAGDDFPGDGGEALFDGARLAGVEHADFFQHGGMGQRAEDVVFPEPPVKGDGLGELGRGGIKLAGEPAAA